MYIPDLYMKTTCFLDSIWWFNGAENGVWYRSKIVASENWFGFGYYGEGKEIWFVFVMLLILNYLKFGKRDWWFDSKIII